MPKKNNKTAHVLKLLTNPGDTVAEDVKQEPPIGAKPQEPPKPQESSEEIKLKPEKSVLSQEQLSSLVKDELEKDFNGDDAKPESNNITSVLQDDAKPESSNAQNITESELSNISTDMPKDFDIKLPEPKSVDEPAKSVEEKVQPSNLVPVEEKNQPSNPAPVEEKVQLPKPAHVEEKVQLPNPVPIEDVTALNDVQESIPDDVQLASKPDNVQLRTKPDNVKLESKPDDMSLPNMDKPSFDAEKQPLKVDDSETEQINKSPLIVEPQVDDIDPKIDVTKQSEDDYYTPKQIDVPASEIINPALMPINIMEELVKVKVYQYVTKLGGCTCQNCLIDVIAITLNSLMPKYTVSHKGKIISKLLSYEIQYATDIMTAMTKAFVIVNESPRHGEGN